MTDHDDTDTTQPAPAREEVARIRQPRLSPEAKARLRARTPEVTGDHLTLRQVRRLQRMTQAQVAAAMGTEQDRVSRLERRADMRLSTLRDYVTALGGSLRLVVDIPGHEPKTVELPQRDATARPRRLRPTHK